MTVVTVEYMAKAIKATHDGMPYDIAKEIAEKHVMCYFGFNEEVIDNVLEPEDRDAFYMLEDKGLLGTRRDEEILSPTNKEWRIFYWNLEKDEIIELANRQVQETEEDPYSCYESDDCPTPQKLAAQESE